MNKILLSTGILALSLFSCKVTTSSDVNPDNGGAIAGTYAIKTYNTETSSNSSVAAGYNLVITKVDKNTVNVLIDYPNTTVDDVASNNVAVTKTGTTYYLSKSFSNASGSGTVSGTTATWDIEYNNGDYVNIIAKK